MTRIADLAQQVVPDARPLAADGGARRTMVVASALRPPAAPPDTVARHALMDRLAESLTARLVLNSRECGRELRKALCRALRKTLRRAGRISRHGNGCAARRAGKRG